MCDISVMPEYSLSSMCSMNHCDIWSRDLFTVTRNDTLFFSGSSGGHAATLAQPLATPDLKSTPSAREHRVPKLATSLKSILEPALSKQILHTS